MPQQALALANSSLCLEQARLLAGRLENGSLPANRSIARRSVRHCRVRARAGPIADPRGNDRLRRLSASRAEAVRQPVGLAPFSSGPAAAVPPSADPAQRAREDLVHVLFNHNDFVTIR